MDVATGFLDFYFVLPLVVGGLSWGSFLIVTRVSWLQSLAARL